MALTDDELSQVKYHLGYGNLTVLARPYFDIALVFTDVLKNNVDTWGENYIRQTVLPNLLTLEAETFNQYPRRQALEVDGNDGVKLDPDELDKLIASYNWWVSRLESITKIERAPLPGRGGHGGGGEITVK